MKKVFQTKKGIGGNCLAACLASLFEIELEEMPDLAPPECFTDWTIQSRLRREWLACRGFAIFAFDVSIDHRFISGAIPEGPHLFAVKSRNAALAAKGYGHYVIGTCRENGDRVDFQVVHDPLGDVLGAYEIVEICFLVPLRPHLQCHC